MIANRYKICSGVGRANTELVAFDAALINAGIANYNLVKVSSILPAGAKEKPSVSAREGALLPTAYGTITSGTTHERIASAVAIGIPQDPDHVGVIMEFEGYCSQEKAANIVCGMVADAMRNHGTAVERIVFSSVDAVVGEDEFVSCISAVSMWAE